MSFYFVEEETGGGGIVSKGPALINRIQTQILQIETLNPSSSGSFLGRISLKQEEGASPSLPPPPHHSQEAPKSSSSDVFCRQPECQMLRVF